MRLRISLKFFKHVQSLRRIIGLLLALSFLCTFLWTKNTSPECTAVNDVGLVTKQAEQPNRDQLRGKEAAKKRLPQCIIIGAKKAGTRALMEFLNLHSKIKRCIPEKHFFSRKYERGLEWYRNAMPKSHQGQITVEKTPTYFINGYTAQRIHDMNSSIKLILIVKEPVKRLVSDYVHVSLKLKWEGKPVRSFEETVFWPNGTVDLKSIVKTGLYSVHFRRWLKYFPREQIHVANGDVIVKDPFKELQKVEKFLGLKPEIKQGNFYFDKKKGFYCIRTANQKSCLGSDKGRDHPTVDPEVIKKLNKFYAPYNKEFYRLSGMDYGWPEE